MDKCLNSCEKARALTDPSRDDSWVVTSEAKKAKVCEMRRSVVFVRAAEPNAQVLEVHQMLPCSNAKWATGLSSGFFAAVLTHCEVDNVRVGAPRRLAGRVCPISVRVAEETSIPTDAGRRREGRLR